MVRFTASAPKAPRPKSRAVSWRSHPLRADSQRRFPLSLRELLATQHIIASQAVRPDHSIIFYHNPKAKSMSTALKQLAQWPPTASTVIGLGIVLGVIDYTLTGSVAQASLVAGIFKVLCPQDASVTGQLESILPALANLIAKGNQQ